METGRITYFTRAENDYQFIKADYESGRVGEVMCYVMQSICERYLKHIIDTYYAEDAGSIMRTHTIRILRDFICSHLPDFQCNWSAALQADGYYFSTRYPGDDAILVNTDDVKACWEAVNEVRSAVISYVDGHKNVKSTDVFEEIKKMDVF